MLKTLSLPALSARLFLVFVIVPHPILQKEVGLKGRTAPFQPNFFLKNGVGHNHKHVFLIWENLG
jgi:hypothetical protein